MEKKEIKCGYTNVEYKAMINDVPSLMIDFQIMAVNPIKIDPEAASRFLSEKLGEYLTIINQ